MSAAATEPPIKPFAPVKKIRIFHATRRRGKWRRRVVVAVGFFVITIGRYGPALAFIVLAFGGPIYVTDRRDRTVEPSIVHT
jgi:hypothetical protein